MNRKPLTLLNVVLAIGLVAASLFVSGTTTGGNGREYDPWLDVNDDGKINMKDIGELCLAYGVEGTPVTKAAITYDSGWVDITDKAGQYFNVTHNLNSTDVIVDITGKTTTDGGVHQKHLGGTDYLGMGWSKNYGKPGLIHEIGRSLVQTSDGGYAIAVTTLTLPPAELDFSLVKVDWTGEMEWNRTYDGIGIAATAVSLVQTDSGGYTIVGSTNSSGAGDHDVWLVNTDASGNIQWNKTYGKVGIDESAGEVVQTVDGGYAIAGRTGDYPEACDFWLVKTDVNGNMQWNKTYHNDHVDSADALIEVIGEGYVMAGLTGASTPGRGIWLVKTDSSGNTQWNKTYGGTEPDSASCVVQTNDGGYALAGETWSFGAGISDFWLVKTDSNGNMQWNRTYGGTSGDYASSLIETSDGGYAIAGETASFGCGGSDFWLVKTDATGNMQWNKTYGGTEPDSAWCMVQASDGGYAIAGGTVSFGSGGYDLWLVKTDSSGNACPGFKFGLAWTDSTADTITLYRGATDSYWNYVRVRIWKIKENP